jgi:hypothetical protein
LYFQWKNDQVQYRFNSYSDLLVGENKTQHGKYGKHPVEKDLGITGYQIIRIVEKS